MPPSSPIRPRRPAPASRRGARRNCLGSWTQRPTTAMCRSGGSRRRLDCAAASCSAHLAGGRPQRFPPTRRAAAAPSPRRPCLRSAQVEPLTKDDRARSGDGRGPRGAPRGPAARAGIRRGRLRAGRPRLLHADPDAAPPHAADRALSRAPQGRRPPHRLAARPSAHGRFARADVRRAGSHRRGEAR